MTRIFRLAILLGIFAMILVPSSQTSACPFCNVDGKTLTQEVDQAAFVVYGKLLNAQLSGGVDAGQTELSIEKIIKPHSYLFEGKNQRKILTLDRYIPLSKDTKEKKFLVFCDLYKGEVDAYRGMPVEGDSDMPEYLAGALGVKNKKQPERLKFFFKYLDNKEFAISNDAFMEFGYADYADYRDMATDLPPDLIGEWLRSPKTRSYRIGLYASMLGHCSKDKEADVKLLRNLVEDPDSPVTTGVDGILAAIVMIKPQEGWKYLQSILSDRENQKFTRRYAGLRALRFLMDYRTDLIKKETLFQGYKALLEQFDIADLAIEDLRKRKAWEFTDQILALKKKESHDIPIIHRSILRFALSSPKPQAAAYVAQQRKIDAELVTDTEELLKLEQDTPSGSE